MDSMALSPHSGLIHLERITENAQGIVFVFSASRSAVACPECGQFTHRVHSRYVRRFGDLPLRGQCVCLEVTCRKFFCTNGSCPRRIFTERLPDLVAPYARRTLRLHQALHLIGLALGGRPAALLASELGMRAGRETILRGLKRSVRSLADNELADKRPVRVVGIDDWAFRKGQRYGTILCDLTNHSVIDLLPDRSVQSAAQWLRQHPEIEILSRDRGVIYAEAGRLGAPQAIQVADRFHLLKNMVDMMGRIVANEQNLVHALFRESALPPLELAHNTKAGDCEEETDVQAENVASGHIQSNPTQPNPTQPNSTQPNSTQPNSTQPNSTQPNSTQPNSTQPNPEYQIKVKSKLKSKLTRTQRLKEVRLEKKRERYEQVKTLRKSGVTVNNIAAQVGVSRRTAQRMLNAEAFPYAGTRAKRRKAVDSYRQYLDERWEGGCHNASQLWREIQAQGFRGSYGIVYAYLGERYQLGSTNPQGAHASLGLTSIPSPRQLAWRLLYPEKSLAIHRRGLEVSQKQTAALQRLLAGDSPLKTATLLARQFIEMVTKRQPDVLNDWIQAALNHGMEELRRFARGIVQDYGAIHAALELDISNGQVEGQVNRLKTIKRQMYGRAGLELLKARVLTRA